jgi:hypothetical protein
MDNAAGGLGNVEKAMEHGLPVIATCALISILQGGADELCSA